MSKPAVFKPWFRAFNAHRWQWWLGFKLALLTVVCGIGLLALSGWFITASAIFVTVNIYAPSRHAARIAGDCRRETPTKASLVL